MSKDLKMRSLFLDYPGGEGSDIIIKVLMKQRWTCRLREREVMTEAEAGVMGPPTGKTPLISRPQFSPQGVMFFPSFIEI